MKIVILAPSHKSFISKFLTNYKISDLPEGYFGAPFIGTLIEELLKNGHEVVAITTTVSINKNYDVREFSDKNSKWIVVPYRRHSINFNGFKIGRILDFYSLERKQLLKVTLAEKPDFIHAHWSYEFAGIVTKCNIPHLVTIHDNPYQVLKYMTNIYRLGRLLMSEWVLKHVKYASTVSPYMIKYVRKKCNNVKIIPNPTLINYSPKVIRNLIFEKTNSISSPIIIMIMNGWGKHKNGVAGLEAFRLIKEKFPKATLHLFGHDTQENGRAYRQSKYMKLTGVLFNGPANHDDLLKRVASAHVLVHPSFEESFGVVLIEAMACGVPVVAGIHSGAVPWVVDNSNLLVDITYGKNIGEKVIELLLKPKIYTKISLQCYYNVINRFSASVIVRQYETYYNEIIAEWDS